MIPLKLSMRNFMCYGEQVSSLDFSGIHLACLAGDNGHGKSAIIDAMTWALWGKARAHRDDDLVHLGAADMEVEFEFLLADNHFRVLRQRQKNGTKGRTTLEFQIVDDGQSRSLTGNTLRQTQAAITETLHMEYETFINSAFLLQGRADEFTAHPPAERKRILGEILDLSQYDRLEQKSKERVRELELQLSQTRAALAEIERELAHRTEYESELEEVEKVAHDVGASLRTQEDRLRTLREQRKELELRRDQLRQLEDEQKRKDSELKRVNGELDQTRERIAGYQSIISEAAGIEEGYSSLLAARETNDLLSRRLSQHMSLNEQKAELRSAVEGARSKLLVERERHSSSARSLEDKVDRAEAVEARLEVVRAELAQLAEREQERESLLLSEQRWSNEIATLRAQNEQLKSEMDLLKEKLDLLQEAEASCPLCGSELQEEERKHIEDNYARDGKEKGDSYRLNTTSIRKLSESLEETRHAREACETELASLASLRGAESTLADRLEETLAAKRELEQATAKLAFLDEQLEREDFASAERASLSELDEQLASLGYDAQEHEKARQRLAETARFEQAKKELDAAGERLKAETLRLDEQEQQAKGLDQEIEELATKMGDLNSQVADLEVATRDLEEQARLVEELQLQDAEAQLRLGAARQKLAHLSYLDKEKEEKSQEERRAQEEKGIYDELRVAFGKKGIQAMIIEATIPEIEEEANRLLARMTDGRLHVRLKSQRETLKGKTVETLDIEVADELGPRSYDLFSGGEAFRINFAIRVALSKLLARRAGARLQTLIVDEGFGTQDAQGRERLVEAIGSIQDDFERILVVTHIEELKDSFPVRIDVFKTPQGSQIAVA
jgi:exonuclease SbcC